MRTGSGTWTRGSVPCHAGFAMYIDPNIAVFAECVLQYCNVLKEAMGDAAEWLKTHAPADEVADDDEVVDEEGNMIDADGEFFYSPPPARGAGRCRGIGRGAQCRRCACEGCGR